MPRTGVSLARFLLNFQGLWSVHSWTNHLNLGDSLKWLRSYGGLSSGVHFQRPIAVKFMLDAKTFGSIRMVLISSIIIPTAKYGWARSTSRTARGWKSFTFFPRLYVMLLSVSLFWLHHQGIWIWKLFWYRWIWEGLQLCTVRWSFSLRCSMASTQNAEIDKKASIRWQDSARRQFQAGLIGDVGL